VSVCVCLCVFVCARLSLSVCAHVRIFVQMNVWSMFWIYLFAHVYMRRCTRTYICTYTQEEMLSGSPLLFLDMRARPLVEAPDRETLINNAKKEYETMCSALLEYGIPETFDAMSIMMMIAFITFKSSLVPLFEGL